MVSEVKQQKTRVDNILSEEWLRSMSMWTKRIRKLKSRFRIRASLELDRYPVLKQKYRELCYWILRFRSKMRGYGVDKIANLNKTYLVNTNRIIYAQRSEFNVRHKGKVIGGDWDLPKNLTRFEDLDVYQAFCQRILDNKNWEDTRFYHRVLGEIMDGHIKWGCISREQLDDRCKKLDKLYQSIRDNGYKIQGELNANSRGLFEEDEITISIARTGELLFTNGRHRLSIAKILGLKKVPVNVTCRHSAWVEFRNEILTYIQAQQTEKLYRSLTHPDLADIPSNYGHDTFNIIKQNLSVKTDTLLDIGSNWGYFCHKFEDEGFDCYAVENSPTSIYFLNKLRQAENKKFKVFFGSIFDYREKTDFDIVLALNIFHHFLKHESSYLKLIELLKRLEMRELFLQTVKHDEAQMENAYKNYSSDDFVAFILEHSCLKEVRCIGEEQDGRPLYRLYR